MASITFDHVTKSYEDGTTAVKDMNLQVEDGEFLILVGPSGCGKSTALRMIAGLEDISEGEMRIGDKVVNDAAPKDRDIAMVFQNYALYPHMSVRDNMAFGLKLAKADKADIEKRVSEAAKILDLEPYLDRKPSQLSGGQRQRVAMGRAIVREPSVFLMDEPLSNLDAKLRGQTRTQIASLQDRLGTTMVYVTHDQTEAMTLGDRVAVMRAGELQQVGTPKELYETPVSLFVAGFIGSPSMNFLPGRVESGRVRFPLGEVALPQGVEASGEVIVGLRPEHFEDARLAPQGHDWVKFSTKVELLESLGSELYAYFTAQGDRAESTHLQELAQDAGMEDLGTDGSQVVARISAESDLRQGQEVELVFDAGRVQLFDPEGGAALRPRSGSGGGRLDKQPA